MSITYDEIIRDLSDFKLSPVKVIKIVKKGSLIERETQCVRCYAPSILKDEYVDFVKTLFQGRGLNISYLPNNEMINIEIPQTNTLHPLFQNIINNTLLS